MPTAAPGVDLHPPVNLYSTDPEDAQDPAIRRIRADLSCLGTIKSIDGLISTTRTQGLVVEGATATLSHEAFTADTVVDIELDKNGELVYSNHGRPRSTFIPPVRNAYEAPQEDLRFQEITSLAFRAWNRSLSRIGKAANEFLSSTTVDQTWLFGWNRLLVSVFAPVLLVWTMVGFSKFFPVPAPGSIALIVLGVATGVVLISSLLLSLHGIEIAASEIGRKVSRSELSERQQLELARISSEKWDSDRSEIFREGFASDGDRAAFLEGLMIQGRAQGIRRMSRFGLVESGEMVSSEDPEGSSRIFRRPVVTFLGTAPGHVSLVNYVFDGTNIFRHDRVSPRGASPIFIP